MTERQPSELIASERVVSTRKTFFLDLKENFRGRFLKITEDVDGNRDTIVIPVEALGAIEESLSRLINENDRRPSGGAKRGR